jgi:hypothetical protein
MPMNSMLIAVSCCLKMSMKEDSSDDGASVARNDFGAGYAICMIRRRRVGV